MTAVPSTPPTASAATPTPAPTPAAAPAPTPAAAPVAVPVALPVAGGKPSRLPPGELRRQVAAVLAAAPTDRFTAGDVTRKLPGRSSGAIGNALAVLADQGAAHRHATTPVRYQATATTGAAAAVIFAPRTGKRAGTPVTPSATPTPTPTPTPAPTPIAHPAPGPASAAVGGARSPGAARASASEPVRGPVVRPNGQHYHPRKLGETGMPDVTALRKLREVGVAALMYGPPGTGKTSVIEAAFGEELVTVAGDSDTTVADLVGEYTQTPEGRYVFVHGPLVRAMREGLVLFIDDATLVPPTVLAVMYPAMDGRRQIVIKANGGEVVDAADGFYVVAGHNPGVHGAVLTDALSSRFSAQIRVSTDYDLAEQLKIDLKAVRAARNLSARHERGEIGWAPQLRELISFQKIADVLGIPAAAGNLVGAAPEEDRATVTEVVRMAFGIPVAPLALGARITTTRT